MATEVEAGRERLRAEIRKVKKTSGASWGDIGSTLRGWAENGIPDGPHDSTLLQVDELIRWKPGSARRVLEGGEPEPLEDVERSQVNDRAIALLRRIASLVEEAAEILEDGS